MTGEKLVEIFGADYPDVKTRNVIITRILAALEKEREGEVVMGSIINGVLKIPQSVVRDLMSENGAVIFRPTKAEKGGE